MASDKSIELNPNCYDYTEAIVNGPYLAGAIPLATLTLHKV